MIVSGNPPKKTNTAHKMSTKAFYYWFGENPKTVSETFLEKEEEKGEGRFIKLLDLVKRVLGGGSGSLFCLFIVFQLLLGHL